MDDSDEIKYWNKFIDGDIDALSIIFLQYAKGLISYGVKIYRDEELVKDSIQEVFIQLIQKRHKLKRNENIKGLVYRLLRNAIIDEIKLIERRRKIEDQIFSKYNNPDTDAECQFIGGEEETQTYSLINTALNRLSQHQKEAMFLKYSNGLSYEQISLVMGISIASTRTLIYRTLKQIKSQIIEKSLIEN